jgi:hypothetical protein
MFEPENICLLTYAPPTFIHLSCLYQCAETRRIEVFWLLSHPVLHARLIYGFRTALREFLDPVVNCLTWQTLPTINRKHLSMNILCSASFCQQKTHNNDALRYYTVKYRRHFDYWNRSLNMNEYAYLLCRQSWSWCVLLPSDTHRKLITSILLPFLTYLLTLSHIIYVGHFYGLIYWYGASV